MGGTDDESNFTYLTVREHILAHFMLWKIHRNVNDLRSMNMLGAKLSVEYRRAVGNWCKENNIGFFSASSEQRQVWRKMGLDSQKASGNKNTFYYWSSEEGRKKRASLGGTASSKTNESWLYWQSTEGRLVRASMGGKAHKGKRCMYKPGDKSFKRVSPDNIQTYIDSGYIFGSPIPSPNKKT